MIGLSLMLLGVFIAISGPFDPGAVLTAREKWGFRLFLLGVVVMLVQSFQFFSTRW